MKKFLRKCMGVLIASTICIAFVSCSQSNTEKVVDDAMSEIRDLFHEAYEKSIDGDVEAFNEVSEFEGLADILNNDVDSIKAAGKLIKKMSEFEYKIKEVNVDKKVMTAKISIRTYDFGKISEKVYDKFDDEIENKTKNGISSDKIQKEYAPKIINGVISELEENGLSYTSELSIKFSKRKDKWRLDSSSKSQILDAIFGGIQKYEEPED